VASPGSRFVVMLVSFCCSLCEGEFVWYGVVFLFLTGHSYRTMTIRKGTAESAVGIKGLEVTNQ
jgi:hypothetical protein